MTSWKQNIFNPIDPSSLVFFRIGFGFLLLIETARYLLSDWISEYYLKPDFLFKFYGFGWVEPWPEAFMYGHFILIGLLSIMIMVGFLYRIAMILMFFAFGYIFLLEQAHYLNHFYLVIIIAFLMIFLPAHRSFSIDAWLRPQLRSNHIPAWSLAVLVIQFEIMLIYAGFVKLNGDWLQGQPLLLWFERRHEMPLIGEFIAQDWFAYFASYYAIILHLIGAPLLFFKQTRFWVFLFYLAFHLSNSILFPIGIFPWFTILGTLLFFSPDWPKRLFHTIFRKPYTIQPLQTPSLVNTKALILVSFFSIFLILQIIIPLRHYLYPGNVAWTEEGHRFSWRMRLRDKIGNISFQVIDPSTQEKWHINPQDYLTKRQTRKMAIRPDLILQFAHYLEKYWQQHKNIQDIEVYANAWASLNGRKYARLIDNQIDLTQVKRDIWPSDWILPLNEPFKR